MIPAAAQNKAGRIGYHIGTSCPGCGGSLEIESDFFVLTCPHCDSKLRLVMPDTPPAFLAQSNMPKQEIRFHVDRYFKKLGLPLTGSSTDIKRLYYPYWKIDAVLLKVRNKEIERITVADAEGEVEMRRKQRMTDIRLTPYTNAVSAGVPNPDFPHSMGMRTEYIKLVPFSETNIDEDYTCLPVIKPWTGALEDLQKSVDSLGRIQVADFGKNRTELFHPTGSLVYFPYYIVNTPGNDGERQVIVDGISGRVIKHEDNIIYDDNLFMGEGPPSQFGNLGIHFHRCTNCGHDLPGKQSAVYICKHCHDLILMEKFPFPLGGVKVASGTTTDRDVFYPFWSFKMTEETTNILKPMFGGIYESDTVEIPGFRLPNFESMYKLTKRMSAATSKIDFAETEELDKRYNRVTMPLSEALTMAEVLIFRELVGRGNYVPADQIKFEPTEVSLYYVPFHPESYFFVDSIINAITFERGLMK